MPCFGEAKNKETVYTWSVPSISTVPEAAIESPGFHSLLLENTRWFLEIQIPHPGDVKRIVVCLHRYLDGPDTLVVDFELEILQNNIHKKTFSRKNVAFNKNAKLRSDQNCFFVFFGSDHEKVKDITVICRLSPCQAALEVEKTHLEIDNDFSDHLRSLLQTNLHFDTLLYVGDSEFKCHKAVLHARIPKILENMKDVSPNRTFATITVTDYSSEAVLALLRYAYGGVADLGVENLMEFKRIAFTYGNEDLQRQLVWRDKPNATTKVHNEKVNAIMSVRRIMVANSSTLNRQKIRIADDDFLEICHVICEMLPFGKENREYICFRLIFPPPVLNRRIVVSGQFSLLFNSTLSIQLCDFKHYSQLQESTLLLKTMRKNSLQHLLPKVLFDDNCFRFELKIEYCRGVEGYEKKNNVFPMFIDRRNCEGCEQLSIDLELLYVSEEYCDVTLISEDCVQFSAHRAILAARSPDFKEILETYEDRFFVPVEGVKARTLSEILRWVYDGRDPEKNTIQAAL